ncbi:MAG: TetR/AcrR family transcriptional regulator [Parasphingopyxis sp.]|uniref:TetR/AcrR family transcriptional regulator n=1 Tax=Parasphingopyxis sp. TaxID=1920299 RepID=UPI0032F02D35
MICRAASCPASSLYWHFDSKENLFAEVVKWKATNFFGLISDDVIDVDSFDEIEDIGDRVADALQNDPLLLRFLLLLGLERQDMPSEARAIIAQVRESARAWWQTLLEKRFQDRGATVATMIAEEYAEFGRSLVDGAFFAWDFGDGPDLRKVFRQLMVLLAALDNKIMLEERASTRGDPSSGKA